MIASQFTALAPTPHVQYQSPHSVTELAAPAVQSNVFGLSAYVHPFANPHTPALGLSVQDPSANPIHPCAQAL